MKPAEEEAAAAARIPSAAVTRVLRLLAAKRNAARRCCTAPCHSPCCGSRCCLFFALALLDAGLHAACEANEDTNAQVFWPSPSLITQQGNLPAVAEVGSALLRTATAGNLRATSASLAIGAATVASTDDVMPVVSAVSPVSAPTIQHPQALPTAARSAVIVLDASAQLSGPASEFGGPASISRFSAGAEPHALRPQAADGAGRSKAPLQGPRMLALAAALVSFKSGRHAGFSTSYHGTSAAAVTGSLLTPPAAASVTDSDSE